MDTLIADGGEIKALQDTGDRMTAGGFLVLFGSPSQHDATKTRDYFDAQTDFDIPPQGATSAVYYHHGLNPTLKTRRIAPERAKLTVLDAGVWMETELEARDAYEAKIMEMIRRGKLGLSSGTASHLVERSSLKNAAGDVVHHIDRWPLGLDASFTPTPGEPRTAARALKFIGELEELPDEFDDAVKRVSKKLPAGHWITHNGQHVFLPEYQVNEDHVFAAGVAHGLGEAGHKALDDAYKGDEIHTAAHLHLSLAHAKRAIAAGADEATAVKAGLKLHGFNGTASHAEKYRDAVDAQKNAQLADANKEAIQARKDRREHMLNSGKDVVEYVSDHAATFEEAQAMAKDLGYRTGGWDDPRAYRQRDKKRAQGRAMGAARSRVADAAALQELTKKSLEDGEAFFEWEIKFDPSQARDEEGKWTVIRGHRVSITGAKVKNERQLELVAQQFNVSHAGVQALKEGYRQGKIATDDHLLRAISHGHDAGGGAEHFAAGVERHGKGGSHEGKATKAEGIHREIDAHRTVPWGGAARAAIANSVREKGGDVAKLVADAEANHKLHPGPLNSVSPDSAKFATDKHGVTVQGSQLLPLFRGHDVDGEHNPFEDDEVRAAGKSADAPPKQSNPAFELMSPAESLAYHEAHHPGIKEPERMHEKFVANSIAAHKPVNAAAADKYRPGLAKSKGYERQGDLYVSGRKSLEDVESDLAAIKSGRVLSADNHGELCAACDAIEAGFKRLRDLLDRHAPDKDDDEPIPGSAHLMSGEELRDWTNRHKTDAALGTSMGNSKSVDSLTPLDWDTWANLQLREAGLSEILNVN